MLFIELMWQIEKEVKPCQWVGCFLYKIQSTPITQRSRVAVSCSKIYIVSVNKWCSGTKRPQSSAIFTAHCGASCHQSWRISLVLTVSSLWNSIGLWARAMLRKTCYFLLWASVQRSAWSTWEPEETLPKKWQRYEDLTHSATFGCQY